MLEARTVSNPYVRTLVAVVEAAGISQAALFAGLQLDAAMLADPNGRIAPERVRALWQRALRLSGDPLLGLKMAEATQATSFRALGLAAASSASLLDALALMLRYHRLVSESGLLSAERLVNGDICISYTEQLQRLRLLPQQVEAIVGGILAMARRLAERRLLPAAVSLRHAPQGDLLAYRRFFGCEPIRFEAARNELVLPAAELARPLPQSDPELHRVHCELLDRQLAGLPQPGSVAAFARQWLPTQRSGLLRIEDLALALGLSVRALQRQLQAEGLRWSELVDVARKESLQALLAEGVSLQLAAERLGYHDASSLSRAAKRWFGSAPGRWRSSGRDAMVTVNDPPATR